MRKYKSAVVRVIHEHEIDYSNLDEYSFVGCKCGEEWMGDNGHSLHADHVAMKILDAFDKIKEDNP